MARRLDCRDCAALPWIGALAFEGHAALPVPWAVTLFTSHSVHEGSRAVGAPVLIKANLFSFGWGIATIPRSSGRTSAPWNRHSVANRSSLRTSVTGDDASLQIVLPTAPVGPSPAG